MLKSILVKTVITSLMLGSFSASANVVVDLFSDNQGLLQVVGTSASSSAAGPDIIGGERDIQVIAGNDVRASAEVLNGSLLIASSALNPQNPTADDMFSVEVQWDGLDNSSDLALPPAGLAPAVDFSTLSGFSATINSSDGAGFFAVTLHDTNNESAVLNLAFIPVSPLAPATFSIPFAFFTGLNPALDLSSIAAVVLKLSSSGDTDISVDAISAVPTPSSLAVLGLGLLGFAGFARRKA